MQSEGSLQTIEPTIPLPLPTGQGRLKAANALALQPPGPARPPPRPGPPQGGECPGPGAPGPPPAGRRPSAVAETAKASWARRSGRDRDPAGATVARATARGGRSAKPTTGIPFDLERRAS